MHAETESSRREFIAATAVGVTALTVSSAAAAATAAEVSKETAMTIVPAFQTTDTLKPLPFDPARLVLDMYEHSYQMDYGGAAAKYIDAFFQNVQWDEVQRRLERAEKAAAALRT